MTSKITNSAIEQLKLIYPKRFNDLGTLSTWADPIQIFPKDIDVLESARAIESNILLEKINQCKLTARSNANDKHTLIRSHLLLNERCRDTLVVAPAFRLEVKFEKFEKGSTDEDLYRSLVIVDLHWLLCNGFSPRDKILKDLFEKGWITLTDSDIHNFLSAKRKIDAKVAQLALPRMLEMECAYLKTEEIKRKRLRLMGVQREKRLKELMLRVERERLPPYASHLKAKPEMCEVLVNVAAAMEVSNIMVGKVTNKETLYWYGRMSGDELFGGLQKPNGTNNNPIERLRRRIKVVRKLWGDVPK